MVPYTPNLIRVRPYQFIRSLSRQGHEVTVATLYTGEAERADALRLREQCHAVEVFELPKARSYANCLAALPGNVPLQAEYCWQPQLNARIGELLERGGFDVVHVEHLRGVKFGLKILEKPGMPPVVWDSVDCISFLFRQAAARSQRKISRLITAMDLRRTERYEGWLARKFPRVLVTSPLDKAALEELSGGVNGNIRVVPNGVDLDYFTPGEFSERDASTLVVSGKMSYHANVSMVLYLVREIMPIIWRQRPEVKLQIVGKDPTSEVLALTADSRIQVTGTVNDLRPYLRRATLAVAPIQYGAGIQNKVLEAMACGTAVVASPQAVSALWLRKGEEVETGDNAVDFAQIVLKLLEDAPRRDALGHHGRAYVERNHRWDGIAVQLSQIYSELIDRDDGSHTG